MLTKTMGTIIDGIKKELEINSEDIEESMARNDGKVTVSCSIGIDGQPHVSGAVNEVKVAISWVKERKKVLIEKTVHEGQAEMDFKSRAAGEKGIEDTTPL